MAASEQAPFWRQEMGAWHDGAALVEALLGGADEEHKRERIMEADEQSNTDAVEAFISEAEAAGSPVPAAAVAVLRQRADERDAARERVSGQRVRAARGPEPYWRGALAGLDCDATVRAMLGEAA